MTCVIQNNDSSNLFYFLFRQLSCWIKAFLPDANTHLRQLVSLQNLFAIPLNVCTTHFSGRKIDMGPPALSSSKWPTALVSLSNKCTCILVL